MMIFLKEFLKYNGITVR